MRAGPNISNSRKKSNPAVLAASKEASASDGLVNIIIEIGRERQRIIMEATRQALRGDDGEALDRARELTGLPSWQRTDTSLPKQTSRWIPLAT